MPFTVLHIASFKSPQEVADMDRYIINRYNAGFESKSGVPIPYGFATKTYRVRVMDPNQVADVNNELIAAGFKITKSEVVEN